MNNGPINLDDRRTAVERRATEMRRRPMNSRSPVSPMEQPHRGSLEDQMVAEPARTWTEVMEKWRFLLDRYALTHEAGDERLQKLIKRALSDMERLRKREERR